MLIRGRDVEVDKVIAEKLLRDAAEHGYAEAQNDLEFSIASGEIDSMDTLEATTWIKLAESHATAPVLCVTNSLFSHGMAGLVTVDTHDRNTACFDNLLINAVGAGTPPPTKFAAAQSPVYER
jgi:TPR repeat protein